MTKAERRPPPPAATPPRSPAALPPRPAPRALVPPLPAPGAEPVRFHVGGQEALHLLVSLAALTVAFAFAFSHLRSQGLLFELGPREVDAAIALMPQAFVLVLLGFMVHEMAHKFVAQRLSLWAEFRSSAGGLGLALLLCIFTPVVFAAPGAVVIVGNATRRDGAVISVAGPLTNILIGFAFLPFVHTGPNPPELGPGIGNFWQAGVLVMALLAVFNLLPVPPLDGSKIARWSVPVYLAMAGLAGVLFFFALGFA